MNANIYTVDAQNPKSTALAVEGARIAALGDKARAMAGAGVKVVDVKGATIIPGFIDSHGHMEGLGQLLELFDLRHVSSIEEVARMVRESAAKKTDGEWVLGRNWDQTNWGGKFPTLDPLTKAAPNRPVYLVRVDGHAAWVNRKAMELAGLTAATKDPPGGKIVRDPSGAPNGVLVDRAMGLVSKAIPAPSAEQIKRWLALAARECARLGLTTVHDAGAGAQEIDAYRELIREGRLPVRVYAMIRGEGKLWKEWLARGPEVGEYLTIRSIKLMADGAMGSRGAAFWQAYSDDPGNTGLLMLQKEGVARVARDAVRHGFQVNTHAIGDRANRVVLDGYGAVLGGENDKRFRIEHAQAISLPDFALFKKYSVIASMQSTHATSDMRWAEARLGPDRVQGAYAPRRFLALGVPVANGSDFPVEEPNPLPGFYAAFTRQDPKGNPAGGWRPDQKMTREEALYSWTMAGAYAAFEEKQKGSLAPGKLADFVVLDTDIMTCPPLAVPKAKVKMTVLGGKVVHDASR